MIATDEDTPLATYNYKLRLYPNIIDYQLTIGNFYDFEISFTVVAEEEEEPATPVAESEEESETEEEEVDLSVVLALFEETIETRYNLYTDKVLTIELPE